MTDALDIREAASAALFALIRDNSITFASALRRFDSWEKATTRPALRMLENLETVTRPSLSSPRTVEIGIHACLYWDAPNGDDQTPATKMNEVLAALDLAMRPSRVTERLDLGLYPRVQDCWVEGEVVKDAGDFDGVGLAIVPIKILLLP